MTVEGKCNSLPATDCCVCREEFLLNVRTVFPCGSPCEKALQIVVRNRKKKALTTSSLEESKQSEVINV